MDFKNEFVAHRKIHVFHFASIEKHASQCHVIDSGSAKNTIIKGAIDKNYPNKVALREIATVESTAFKFLQIDFLLAINKVVVFDVKEILGHKWGNQKLDLNKKRIHFRVSFPFFRDLDWIQTSNLLSRNQMRYSVAPRGLNAGANIGKFYNRANLNVKLYEIFFYSKI